MTNTILVGGRPIEILLVEDDPEQAEWTQQALREGRVRNRVHWVSDGEEAMTFLHRQGPYSAAPRPDLILLDHMMPRKTGLEVLAEIKEDARLRRIPVIMMTGTDNEKHVLQAYDLHVNCYVKKPIDVDEFLDAVRSIEDFWLTLVHLPAA